VGGGLALRYVPAAAAAAAAAAATSAAVCTMRKGEGPLPPPDSGRLHWFSSGMAVVRSSRSGALK